MGILLNDTIYKQGFFDKMIKMRGNNLMLTSKLHVLLNISDPVDRFHEFSMIGILLMR